MMTLMLLLMLLLFVFNIVDVAFKFHYERKTITFNLSPVTFLLLLTAYSIINNVVRDLNFQKPCSIITRQTNFQPQKLLKSDDGTERREKINIIK